MYTNIIVGEKNLIIVAGGVIIILLVVTILTMLELRKSNNQSAQEGSYYSTPTVNQGGESEMNILVSAQNNSNESGIANLKDTRGVVTVTLNLTGYIPNVAQPAHIHMGACPGVGAVRYPLNSVVNGRSVTLLDVGLTQLKQQLPLAINVHESATNIATYTSCGSL